MCSFHPSVYKQNLGLNTQLRPQNDFHDMQTDMDQ